MADEEPSDDEEEQEQDEEDEQQSEEEGQVEDDLRGQGEQSNTNPSKEETGMEELQKVISTKKKHMADLQKTLSEEQLLKIRVSKLRGDLLQSRSTTAMHRYAMNALQSADAEKQEMKRLKGLQESTKGQKKKGLGKVTAATESDLRKLSMLVQAQHTKDRVVVDPELRTWYGLFKKFDINRDGCITFEEFQRMLRSILYITADKVSDKALASAWKTLDDDKDGLVDAGAFGRFYRKANIEQQASEFAARRKLVNEQDKQGLGRIPQMKVGIVGVRARSLHRLSRAKLEADAVTPMQEARIEARKLVERWERQEKKLKEELKKIVKEEKKLEAELSSRGALKSKYGGGGSTSSLAASISASRAMIAQADLSGGAKEEEEEGAEEGAEGEEGQEAVNATATNDDGQGEDDEDDADADDFEEDEEDGEEP